MAVTLDWLGTATFRLIVDDTVIFLDGYVERVPSAPAVGISLDEIERADCVLVGHSHFDHLWGVERIAIQTAHRSSAPTRRRACWSRPMSRSSN